MNHPCGCVTEKKTVTESVPYGVGAVVKDAEVIFFSKFCQAHKPGGDRQGQQAYIAIQHEDTPR